MQNKTIAEAKNKQQAESNRIKELGMRYKAEDAWDNSQDKIILEKDLKDQKSNWRKDTKLDSDYKRKRQNFINRRMQIEAAETLNANDIAPLPQQ